eukprot:1262435-Pyramimonas_sp.AAC.1
MYVIASNPFYLDMEMSVQRRFHGVVRCCADGAGGLIRTAKGLREMVRTFRWAELLAGLSLKIKEM